MKKLFYFLFVTSFFITSCSDDKDFFTRDVEYSVHARVLEIRNPTLQNMIYVSVSGGDWHIKGYDYKPKLTQIISEGTLFINCGELEYTKYDERLAWDYAATRTSVAPEGCYAMIPQIDFPSDISKIVISRKDAEDIYNIDRSGDQLTIIPQKKSFSEFNAYKYLTRPENSFSVYFPNDNELHDEFFQFISTSIPVTAYEYDSTIEPLWYMMASYYNTKSVIYQYQNEDDNKKIIRLFDEFCDEVSKNKVDFRAFFGDWTGEELYYPAY